MINTIFDNLITETARHIPKGLAWEDFIVKFERKYFALVNEQPEDLQLGLDNLYDTLDLVDYYNESY